MEDTFIFAQLGCSPYSCSNCGAEKDRDLNASANLEHYPPAVSSTVAACGDSKVSVYGQCESVKQETDIN
jgi:transposase